MSPLRKVGVMNKDQLYFSASLDCVIQRDVKGLYAKSSARSINNMIGVSITNPFQPPKSPDFIINTEKESIQHSVEKLFNFSVICLSKVNHTGIILFIPIFLTQ